MAENTSFKYAVDLAFCIDVTGSMAPVLDLVKNSAISLHSKIEAAMALKGKSISQLRIRVIAFRDFADRADNAIHASDFWTIPDQTEEFAAFVKRLDATDGGDEPESALEALALAINSPWERGLDRRRHVIIVFTDASAHPLGTGSFAATYPPNMPRSQDELFEMWGYKTSQSATMEHAAKRLLIFAPDTTPWNVIANDWNSTVYFASQAGRGMEEFELDEIIEVVANSV